MNSQGNGTAPPLSLAEIVTLVGNSGVLGFTVTNERKDGQTWVTVTPTKHTSADTAGVNVSAAKYHAGQPAPLSIPVDRWYARQIIAASIIYAESGGYPEAVNVNGPTSSAPGSTDRGLWQWNSEAWPDITDAAAKNPKASTVLAWCVSNAWSDFGPWAGSRGLDPTSDQSRAVQREYLSQLGRATDDTPILSWIDKDANAIPDPVDAAAAALGGWDDIAHTLYGMLRKLADPEWWKRVGVVLIGAIMVVLALTLIRS